MSLRDLERASIRAFVEAHADKLTGRVLDLGCGKQPYREIVELAGGQYTAWDRVACPGSVATEDIGPEYPLMPPQQWDAILTTQTIQYVTDPRVFVRDAMVALVPRGWLVMTGPTNWPVVETDDLWRFTPAGAKSLLFRAGFLSRIEVVGRAETVHEGEQWLLGWGAVARA